MGDKEDKAKCHPPRQNLEKFQKRSIRNPGTAKALHNFGVRDLRELLNRRHEEQEQVQDLVRKDQRQAEKSVGQSKKFHVSQGKIENLVNIKIELSTSTGTRSCVVDETVRISDIKHVPDHKNPEHRFARGGRARGRGRGNHRGHKDTKSDSYKTKPESSELCANTSTVQYFRSTKKTSEQPQNQASAETHVGPSPPAEHKYFRRGRGRGMERGLGRGRGRGSYKYDTNSKQHTERNEDKQGASVFMTDYDKPPNNECVVSEENILKNDDSKTVDTYENAPVGGEFKATKEEQFEAALPDQDHYEETQGAINEIEPSLSDDKTFERNLMETVIITASQYKDARIVQVVPKGDDITGGNITEGGRASKKEALLQDDEISKESKGHEGDNTE